MDDRELLERIVRRIEEVQLEKGELEAEITELGRSIEAATARLPKRKGNMTESEILATVAELEFKRTTSSMPLAAEKTLLREQEQLKGRIKDVREYQLKNGELNAMRDRRRAAEESARSKRDSLRELQVTAKRITLAVSKGVPSANLVKTEVTIPDDRVGLVMGKRRTALAAIEEECGVICEEHIVRDTDGTPRAGAGSESMVYITGTLEACVMAKARLEKVTMAVELNVNVTAEVAAALRINKWVRLRKLEAEHDCRIDLVPTSAAAATGGGGKRGAAAAEQERERPRASRSAADKDKSGGGGAPARPTGPARATVKGMPANAEAAVAALKAMRGASEHIPLDERAIPAVVGKGGCNIQRIEAEHGVAVDVRREAGEVVVAGEAGAVAAAAVELRQLADDNASASDSVALASGFQASLLLRNGGEALKAMQRELGVSLQIERASNRGGPGNRNGPPPSVMVSGAACKIQLACDAVAAMVAAMEEKAVTVELDPESLSAVVGKGGARIKELRETAGGGAVVIDVDWDLCAVRLFGDDEAAVAAVAAAVEAVADANRQRVLHLPRETAVALKGQRGAAARAAITNAADDSEEANRGLGVSMEIQAEQNGRIRLRGCEEALEAAANILAAFAAENVGAEVDVMPDDSAVLNGGGEGGLLKRIAAEFGVEARLVRDRSSVRLLGTGEAVEAAAEWLRRQLFGADDGSVAMLALDPASMGPIIGRGGATVRRLEKECGVAIDALSSRNIVRLRGEPAAVAAARISLLRFVAETKVVGIVGVSDGQQWPSASELRLIGEQCAVVIEAKRWGGRSAAAGEGSSGNGEERHDRDGSFGSSNTGGGGGRGGGHRNGAGGRGGGGGRANGHSANGGGGRDSRDSRDAAPSSQSLGSRGELRIRGCIPDVEEAKIRLTEIVTGVAHAEIRLEPSQAAALGALEAPLRQTLAAAAGMAAGDAAVGWSLEPQQDSAISLVLEGAPQAVGAARRQAFAALSALFPGQFLEVSGVAGGGGGSSALAAAIGPAVVDSVARNTGATVSVDRACSCVRVRAATAAAASAGASMAAEALAAWADRNASVAVEPWLVPLLVGKGGTGLKALAQAAAESGGSSAAASFDLDKEGVCRVSAGDPEALRAGVAALKARLAVIMKENGEVRLPQEAMGGFIGRGGANINRLRTETGANFSVDSANDGRVAIRGNEAAVAAGVAAVEEFLRQWRVENEVEEVVNIGQKGAAALSTSSGAAALAALHARLLPSATLSLDVASGAVRLRGTAGACRRAHDLVKAAADAEMETAKERAAAAKKATAAKKAAAAAATAAEEKEAAAAAAAAAKAAAKAAPAKGNAGAAAVQNGAAAAPGGASNGRSAAPASKHSNKNKAAEPAVAAAKTPAAPPGLVPPAAASSGGAAQAASKDAVGLKTPPLADSAEAKQLLSFLLGADDVPAAAAAALSAPSPPAAAANGMNGHGLPKAAASRSPPPPPIQQNGGGTVSAAGKAPLAAAPSAAASQLAAMLLGDLMTAVSPSGGNSLTSSPRSARGAAPAAPGASGTSHFTSASGLKVRL